MILQAYADSNNLFFMETSAKTALNVNDIFLEIGMCVHIACMSQVAFEVDFLHCNNQPRVGFECLLSTSNMLEYSQLHRLHVSYMFLDSSLVV